MEAVMVVEVLDGDARGRHRIVAPTPDVSCTVGRSPVCDVILDDPFVAAVHARITVEADGTVRVSELEGVNGIEIGGQRLHGADRVPVDSGTVFRVGRTRLRVRTAHEVVAPELVDTGRRPGLAGPGEQRILAIAFVVTTAMTAFGVWTRTPQPRELSTALVTILLITFAVAGLWIALWALASRVAFGESRWVRHAVVALTAYAAFAVVDSAVDLVNGALGLHLSPPITGMVWLGIAASAALVAHLVNASTMRVRTALAIGVTIPAVAIAALLWIQVRGENRNPSHIGDNDWAVPPALLLRRGVPLDVFAATLGDLRAKADARRAFVEREDPSPVEDDSE